ncbi:MULTISPECIES: glutamate 5-kinase [unclassified Dysgonomonas]|uniref:glutamate 5-kinase n=1 Tax=unclassified Dysgonomonas TaxID=2630389 RepID=UPI00068087A1|nr:MULTISPECIES: glutamate 5-kinase [unclassified Dysgonomonas]MBD8348211.1 glutamate 5-kinase [Dysgonomonas sp. HGC4]MBF0575811.1 glutamate 5-kinase [Dysgonomonas sp. GY617]
MKKENSKKNRIVIKIGSNVLTRKDGTLDVTRMSALVDQIAALRKSGIEIILVSSGAVASGKSTISPKSKLDVVSARQLYSAIGQVKLINQYFTLFDNYNIVCGQILATKEDFATRRHYLNQRNCMTVMLQNGVTPIVNENDTISVNELMFTDNDELSGLVATMMNCQTLIILSNIDGIYNGNPVDPKASVIAEIDPKKDQIEEFIQTSKSTSGRGGMQTKYNIARKIAEEGIEVIIANGKKDDILLNLISDPKTICTRFKPSKKAVSNVKKWIAHSESFAKGEVHINDGAKEALISEKAVSLLPVGIVKIEGDFEVDDIVKIIDNKKKQIGVGRIAFDSKTVEKLIGKSNEKPIIHYDYLYIDKS